MILGRSQHQSFACPCPTFRQFSRQHPELSCSNRCSSMLTIPRWHLTVLKVKAKAHQGPLGMILSYLYISFSPCLFTSTTLTSLFHKPPGTFLSQALYFLPFPPWLTLSPSIILFLTATNPTLIPTTFSIPFPRFIFLSSTYSR